MWLMHISSLVSTVPWILDAPTNFLQYKYIYDRVKEYLLYFWSMKYATVVWIDLFVCISDTNLQNLFSIHLFVSKVYLLL